METLIALNKTNMETLIVLIPVMEYKNSKQVAEDIQGKTFKRSSLRNKILSKLKKEDGAEDGITIISLAEFINHCNESDSMSNDFVASVNVE
jgi:hypothetical protein